MPTFNGETLTITLDSGVTNIDWIDVYSEWKDWMLASPANRGYPEAFRTTGGDPLNTLLNSGSYWFLRNDYGWRIKPPEENITILAAGNLAPEDANIDMFLPTTGAYTTQILGLQPVTQGFSPALGEGLRYNLFNGGVTVDIINGVTGTGYTLAGNPIGTPKDPVNNLSDARTIATTNGFDVFYIIESIEIDTSLDFTGIEFIGQSVTKTLLTVNPNATVTKCEFYEASVTGTLDGQNKLRNCLLQTLNFVNGVVEECLLGDYTVTLGGGVDAYFLDCWSAVAGTGTPIINMGGSGQKLGLRNYNGQLKITNMTGADDNISLDLNSANIVLDSTTITAGTVVCRGVGSLVDENGTDILTGTWNGGVTVVNTAMDTSSVSRAVHTETIEGSLDLAETLKIILAATAGASAGAKTGTFEYKSVDGITTRIRATFDPSGNRQITLLDGS